MALRFGDGADGVGEGQGVLEVGEAEQLFQLHDAVAHLDVPVRNLADQLGQFGVGDLRRASAAGFAVGLGQGIHGGHLDVC
ncbi:hypothetical protein D3C81_1587550 [compost metagenome]